jgi:2-desacetyl-2-hydroxyethyl bacteriochlorophyllide A dehydrogenase
MKQISLNRPFEFIEKNAEMPLLGRNELLVQVKSIGICGTDIHAFYGNQPYFNYPRVLGHELSGIIVDSTSASKAYIEKQVCIIPYLSCGKCSICQKGKTNCCTHLKVIGVHVDGGYGTYLAVPEENIILSQEIIDFDHLSMVEPLSIAYHGIERAGISENDWVIIFGAGPIGIGALIFTRYKTNKIILIDVNQHRINYCKSKLSIDHTFNGLDTNLNEHIKELTQGNFADILIDATGNKQAIQMQLAYLAHGGKWIWIGLQKEELRINHPEFHKREATLMSSRNATKNDFQEVLDKIQQKEIFPDLLITHHLLFEEVVTGFPELIKEATYIKGIIHLHESE